MAEPLGLSASEGAVPIARAELILQDENKNSFTRSGFALAAVIPLTVTPLTIPE